MEQTAYTYDECLKMLKAFGNYLLKLNRCKDGKGRAEFLEASRLYERQIPTSMKEELRTIKGDLESALSD